MFDIDLYTTSKYFFGCTFVYYMLACFYIPLWSQPLLIHKQLLGNYYGMVDGLLLQVLVVVMGIGHIFEIEDRYTNIDRWSIISDNSSATKCIYWL